MLTNSISFIGGGRVTRIVLSAAWRAGFPFDQAVVTDIDRDALAKIEQLYPQVKTSDDNRHAASSRIVLIAVPPQEVIGVAGELATAIDTETAVVSLAPKVSSAEIGQALNGHPRVARMIPNAPSLLGVGFSPFAFSPTFPESERAALVATLSFLGELPVVPEEQLEAWAVVTGMGPTYFWFQMIELERLAEEFGLDGDVARRGIEATVAGSARALFRSGLPAEDVLDLIPFHPLRKDEEQVRATYRMRLGELFSRLGGQPAHSAP